MRGSDIVQLMMDPGKQMVVPHCLLGFNTYDYNSWAETTESWALQVPCPCAE